MATETTQAESFYKAWAWFETNKKQVGYGAVILVVVGLLVFFFVWQQGEKETKASQALSDVATARLRGTGADTADAYLKIANDYPKSSAGMRALLLAAGSSFTEGKYDQAKAQFEKFLREHRGSPYTGQALLGIAACQDALGKADDAIKAYKDLVEHPRDNVTPQAKYALARLYETQGKDEDAFKYFEELVRSEPYGTLGSEAGMRAEELKLKNPKLGVNTNIPPANLPPQLQSIPPVNLEEALSNAAPGTATPGTSATPAPVISTTNVVPLFAPPSNAAPALTLTNVAPPAGSTSAPPKQ